MSDDVTIVRCANCRQEGNADDQKLFRDIRYGTVQDRTDLICERLEPGGVFTPYECVGCGALAYLVEPDPPFKLYTRLGDPAGPLVTVRPEASGVDVDISKDHLDTSRPLQSVTLYVDYSDGKTQVVCSGVDDEGDDPLVCLLISPDFRNIQSIVVRRTNGGPEKLTLQ